MSSYLKLATQELLNSNVTFRPGEVKLGERILLPVGDDLNAVLGSCPAQFVLLGIPEDIGVRANGGIGGAHTAWQPALKALLNVQHTDSLLGEQILLLGAFDFSEWMFASIDGDIQMLRNLVSRIDDEVYPVIETIVAAGKVPVVIGGGHNNAYPLLKGASRAMGQALNCINLDAHSDYRAIEGRHSGNGFRYAKMDGYLDRYSMVGLHRNYNSQAILTDLLANADFQTSFYEEIYIEEKCSFHEALIGAARHTTGTHTGVELDLDCIQHTLSSAATPSGLSPLHARKFVHFVAQNTTPTYLHITEGALSMSDGRNDGGTAKLIAYLATDFIRAYQR